MKNKLAPVSKLVSNSVFRAGEKPHRIGEVVFIQDENTLLLAVPGREQCVSSGKCNVLSIPDVTYFLFSKYPLASLSCGCSLL